MCVHVTQDMFEFASFCALRKRSLGLWGLGLDLCCPLGTGLWFFLKCKGPYP